MPRHLSPKFCHTCGGPVGFGPIVKSDGLLYESQHYGNRNVSDQGHLCQTPECPIIGVLCVLISIPKSSR